MCLGGHPGARSGLPLPRTRTVRVGSTCPDVDLTNILDPDCEDIVSDHIRRACHSWQLDTSVGVAGVHDKYVVHVQTDPNTGRADGVWQELVAVYIQLKVSDPDDEEEMQALRDRLHPDTFGSDWEVITIPVRYDFGELWRWSVVLDRFALSAGNTVGITGAGVTYNTTGHDFRDEPLVWMNGVEPLGKDPAGSDDWGLERGTHHPHDLGCGPPSCGGGTARAAARARHPCRRREACGTL